MIILDFFMLLTSKTMVYLGMSRILPLNILLCLRHGYRGATGSEGVNGAVRACRAHAIVNIRVRPCYKPNGR